MKTIYLPALALLAFTSCGRNDASYGEREASGHKDFKSVSFNKEKQRTEEAKNEDEVMSSSAAKSGFSDSLHKFIRTANLKFRTGNVIQSSFAIEDIVAQQKGYVEHSQIASEVEEENYVKCSKDSAWRVTKFVTYNKLTVRVPVANLDQTLKSLRPFVVYLNHRTVDAVNISFDMYANQLMQKRVAVHGERIDAFAPKDQAAASDQLLERQIEADGALVENMRTLDQVKFSTIDIYMYQNPEVKMEKIPVFGQLKSYDSGFGIQLKESLLLGWKLVEVLFLLIVKAWSLLLILVVTLVLIRMRRKRKSQG